jgi:MFS family permease
MFLAGQLFSTTGAWVQRIAQDWLVLSLTGDATAVGVTTALQFLPTLLFGLAGGWMADRWPKRRVLLTTQTTMAFTAATLACLTLTHHVTVWHIDVIAFVLGTAVAVDQPTRQSFVNEMVPSKHLRNAICLNASVFQFGALAGPAISGALIENVGPGYCFAVNALSYAAPVVALLLIRTSAAREPGAGGVDRRIREGLRHVARNNDISAAVLLMGAFGLFTTNLPVTLAAYAKSGLHLGAGGYGLLSTTTAVGALLGALISAQRSRTTPRALFGTAGSLAALYALASAVTGEQALCVVLVPIGAATVLMSTSANALVQLATASPVRGRVMGVYVLVFIGSGAIGGPLVGGIDQRLGPRAGLLAAGVVPAVAVVLVRLGHRARSNPHRAGRSRRARPRTQPAPRGPIKVICRRTRRPRIGHSR